MVATLDDVARRAAEAGVELEPLPPAPPEAAEDEDEGEEDEEEAAEAAAAAEAAEAAEKGKAWSAAPMALAKEGAAEDRLGAVVAARTGGGAKPPVGTRSAAQLKLDADAAFKEARLGHLTY